MIGGTLLLDDKRDTGRRMLPGHGPKVLVDSRQSLYSLLGDLFAQVVSFAAAGTAAALMVTWFVREKKGKE